MRPIIVDKAYELNREKIREGSFFEDVVVYATTRGKAKSLIFEKIENLGYEDIFGEELDFLNLPVRRCKKADRVLLGGIVQTVAQYERFLREQEREKYFRDLLVEHKGKLAHIIKRGSYYGPDWKGYVDKQWQAGVYTLEEAVQAARDCQDITLRVFEKKEYNEMIIRELRALSTFYNESVEKLIEKIIR